MKTHSLLTSPNGRIDVAFSIDAGGQPRYEVSLDRKPRVAGFAAGLVREDADFSNHLELVKEQTIERVRDDYEMLTSKRRHNHYVANRRVVELKSADGEALHVIFPVSDDGVAFRYRVSAQLAEDPSPHVGSFIVPVLLGTQAWLQPDVGCENRLPRRESRLRGGVRAGHSCRHAIVDRRGLGLSGAVQVWRHLDARERGITPSQLLRQRGCAPPGSVPRYTGFPDALERIGAAR